MLGEEAAEEGAQHAEQLHAGVATAEGLFGQEEHPPGGVAKAHEAIEEEVVQLVRAQRALRLLRVRAVGGGREQLGADGRLGDVQEGAARLGALGATGQPLHHGADERLGHARVDAVHRHVVAVEGAPAEGQLRKVARADHQGALHVGQVHEDLRPFARLSILVSRVGRSVVADVAEVLLAGGTDGDLAQGDALGRHQGQGVVVRAIGGTKAGHGDADDAFAGQLQEVEGGDGDHERQRRVESARDADHGAPQADVAESLGQCVRLDAERLTATPIACGGLFGHEGMRGNGAPERTVVRVQLEGEGVLQAALGLRCEGVTPRKVGVAEAVMAQGGEIHLADEELLVGRERLRLGHDPTAVSDEGLAVEEVIRRRFAMPGRDVDETGDAAAGVLPYDVAQRIVSADLRRHGVEVKEHAGPLRGTLGTGGHRTEEVVAQRDGKREGLATKTQLGTDVERDASDLHIRGGEALARPAVNHRTEDSPGLEDDGRLTDAIADAERCADNTDDGEGAREP